MDLTKIKIEVLPKAVKEWCEAHATSRTTTFCQHLEYIDGEIIARIFASRIRNKNLRVTEVLRKRTGSDECFIKNLLFSSGSGYVGVYCAEDIYYHSYGYPLKVFSKSDFDVWYEADAPVGFSYVCINSNIIFDIPEFKYCGYRGGDVISYINEYRKDKRIEFFGKLELPLSRPLMKKANSDGKFRRWLWENHKAATTCGVQAILFAYKNGITCEEARRACFLKNKQDRLVASRIPSVIGTKINRSRLLDYVDSNNIDYAVYNDYLTAIKTLGYNINDTKNVFPNDFKSMHDLRSSEYASHKIKEDKKKREKLYRDFRKVAKGYIELEYCGDSYSLVIPRDISELILEGEILSHCVGKMGYDKKMVDGTSLIAFCRKNTDIKKPFATVEYDLKRNSVKQFYGFSNSKPPEDAIEFVSTWAKNIKKLLADRRQYE